MTTSERPYTTTVTLRDGRRATVRPLEASDVDPLTALFLSLSEDTRSRYAPHPFDRPTAEKLCASIDNGQVVRFVAVLNDGQPDIAEIIGYIILARHVGASDLQRYGDRIRAAECGSFAPVVADAYQNQGVGTLMGRHILACAREMGLTQVVLMGGVLATNARAQHFYAKLGFYRVGEFWPNVQGEDKFSYDMMRDL